MRALRTALIVSAVTGTLLLTGCTSSTGAAGRTVVQPSVEDEKKDSLVKIQSYTNGGRNLYTKVFEQTMPDGRIVPCIYASSAGTGGGVSCDWDTSRR